MNTKQLRDFRSQLQDELQKVKDKLGKELYKAEQKYISKNSPFKVGQVLKQTSRSKKRMQIQFFGLSYFADCAIILAYGYFVNPDGSIGAWNGKGFTVYGIGNIDSVLADNQDYNKEQLKEIIAKLK